MNGHARGQNLSQTDISLFSSPSKQSSPKQLAKATPANSHEVSDKEHEA